jgi:hypothetical protein
VSNRQRTTAGDGTGGSAAALLAGLDARLPERRRARRFAVGAAALVVAARLVATLLYNAPYDPLAVPAAFRGGLAVATTAALAIALGVVAVTARRPAIRVGSLFAAAFGPLAVVDASATLPAVLGVALGGAVALAGVVGRPTNYVEGRNAVVAAGFAIGVGISLSSTTGLLGGGWRAVGAALALGSLAATGLFGSGARPAGRDYAVGLAGLAAFLAVVAAGLASPYVFGSVLLVGFAVVGVPHLLFALAVAGGVAAAVGALRRRAFVPAFGAVLLLAAGAPVTLPRATAVLLGAVVVLSDAMPSTESGVTT